MATTLIHLDPKQKKRLARRAKLLGTSFSQEVRDAIDLYLDIPIETEENLSALASEANCAADGMIKKLDETIAGVDCTLGQMRKSR
jgi:Ribbon-helix-helix protein, copG family